MNWHRANYALKLTGAPPPRRDASRGWQVARGGAANHSHLRVPAAPPQLNAVR